METEKLYRCIRCGIDKPVEEYRHHPASGNRAVQCKTCYSRYYTSGRKLAFLKAFDFKCSCCGEKNPYFLTLDHVKNDGAEHRKRVSQVTILTDAKRENFDKSKYDCLCMNCNFAKGHYGECPHKAGLTPEAIIARYESDVRKIGRDHVPPNDGSFSGGPDPRRMQVNRRVLKPCFYCKKEFGTNEMVRHKKAEHLAEMKRHRDMILALGRAAKEGIRAIGQLQSGMFLEGL